MDDFSTKKTSTRIALVPLAVLMIASQACDIDPSRDEETNTVTSQITISSPGCGIVQSNSICICADPNFNNCTNLTAAKRFYMNLSLFPYTQHNDRISSLWIGPDAKAKFCLNPGGAGSCVVQSGLPGDGYIDHNLTAGCFPACLAPSECSPWCYQNDQTTSIRVDNLTDDCFNPGPGRVAVFEHGNFGGDCVVLDPGYYNHPFKNASVGWNGGGFGLGNDVISSLIVGSSATICLWSEPDFIGAIYTSPIGPSSNTNLTANGMNDRTSSIQVF